MHEKDAISPASTAPTCVASFSRSSTATEQTWDSAQVPFAKCNQLCRDLEYVRHGDKPSSLRHLQSGTSLPDAPRVQLDRPSQVLAYCMDDVDTPQMNKLGKKLWRAGPTPDVVSLTQHTVLERRIQLTEDPSVHLLWVDGIIFLKPLPAYLTSFAFWAWLMDPLNIDISTEERERLQATSLGFLKTYASLIQRRSDFNLARKQDLLSAFDHITFEQFVDFISSFDKISSSSVSSRWRYGLVHLDALNFHSAFLLRRWHLNRFEARHGTYFSRFFPVVLFMFALFSVILNAMQVIATAKQMWDTDNKGLKKSLNAFVWFGTEAIVWSITFGGIFVVWWIGIACVEAVSRRRTKREVEQRLKRENVSA